MRRPVPALHGWYVSVVYFGEEESLELDVFKTARLLDRTLIGCEMAFKPECIEMVAKRGAGHPKVLPRV